MELFRLSRELLMVLPVMAGQQTARSYVFHLVSPLMVAATSSYRTLRRFAKSIHRLSSTRSRVMGCSAVLLTALPDPCRIYFSPAASHLTVPVACTLQTP